MTTDQEDQRPLVLFSFTLPAQLPLAEDWGHGVRVRYGAIDDLPHHERDTVVGWCVDGSTCVDGTALARLPGLRVISQVGVGYDNIDVMAAERAGVVVSHTRGVTEDAVAELTIGLMIAATRSLIAGHAHVRSGAWQHGPLPLSSGLSGKTLGVVGMGEIGSRVATIALALGMRVFSLARSLRSQGSAYPIAPSRVTPVSRERLLQEVDVLSIHLPLDSSTRGSFGAAEFAQMKRTAIVVNTSRGAIIDEGALREALIEGRIAGAALDVFTNEPLVADDPILSAPGVIFQPHTGSATVAAREAMLVRAVENLLLGVSGSPRDVVRSSRHNDGATPR